MKTITSKHILIVQMEVLQSETDSGHIQTTMRVLNEMTYEKYEKMVAALNLVNQIKHYFEDEES